MTSPFVYNDSSLSLDDSVKQGLTDRKPYFVGKDVAEILGYSAPRNAIATHVDDEDKTTALIQCDDSNYKSNAVVINESGLYSLILSSKLPAEAALIKAEFSALTIYFVRSSVKCGQFDHS